MFDEKIENPYACVNAVKYDLKQGILRRYYVYAIIIIPFVMLSVSAVKTLDFMDEKVTFMNILILIFKGCMEFSSENESFRIPLEYMSIIIMSTLIHGWYVKSDFSKRGSLVILRMRNMKYWWKAKCVWGICSVFLYMGILILSVVVVNLICGTGEMGATSGINNILEYPLKTHYNMEIFLYVCVIPLFTLVALTQLQIFIQVFISPVAGMITNVIIMVVSAFEFSSYALGNNMMVLRMSIIREDGVQLQTSLLICLVLYVTVYIAGMQYIKKAELF